MDRLEHHIHIRLFPSAASVSPWASWGTWWLTSRHLCGHLQRGHWRYPWWHWACPCKTGLPLDFVVECRGSHCHQGLQWFQAASIPCCCSGNSPEEGATLGLLLPKQGKNMVFLVGTPAYIGPWLWSAHWPLVSYLHQPITIQAFFVSDQFLGMVGRANVADQRKITCRHQLLVLCMCSCRRNIVEYSETT